MIDFILFVAYILCYLYMVPCQVLGSDPSLVLRFWPWPHGWHDLRGARSWRLRMGTSWPGGRAEGWSARIGCLSVVDRLICTDLLFTFWDLCWTSALLYLIHFIWYLMLLLSTHLLPLSTHLLPLSFLCFCNLTVDHFIVQKVLKFYVTADYDPGSS